MRWSKLLLLPVLLLLAACSVERQVTITTQPPDATLRIDNVDRGRAPLTERFIFNSAQDIHRITATRPGYKDQTVTLTRDYDQPGMQIDLKPLTKRITINVEPAAAIVSIDGRPVANHPVPSHSTELDFTLDNNNKWTTYTITAERPGFEKSERTITWTDPSTNYTITLEPKKKSLEITTTPPRAEIMLDGVKLGTSPVSTAPVPFPIDLQTNTVIPRKITASKPGYDPIELSIGWDDAKTDYQLTFVPKTKTIKVASNPPGSEIAIKGVQGVRATVDSKGIYTFTLSFPPINEQGDLITYQVIATKAPANGIEWHPGRRTLAWDNGKTDYTIDLAEVMTKPLPLLVPEMAYGEDGNWKMSPKVASTLAMRVPAEPQSTQADMMIAAGKDEFIDSLSVSPDGNLIAYSVITGKAGGPVHGQLRAIQINHPGSEQQLTDGRSLDIMPSFTPDGKQIVFATNRNGRRIRIARMNTDGSGGIEHITTEDANDLWPVIDADPKPRLYFERLVDGRPDPRIYQSQLGSNIRIDLMRMGGYQPRVAPSADAVVFTAVDSQSGKRDIYRMKEGQLPENLTNSPDVDEYDPIYSRDGSKIAFVSDRGVIQEPTGNTLDNGSPETQEIRNDDIWVMDANNPSQMTQITTNGSQDDSPAWNFDGSLIYFRSNRNAEWGIWRIKVK